MASIDILNDMIYVGTLMSTLYQLDIANIHYKKWLVALLLINPYLNSYSIIHVTTHYFSANLQLPAKINQSQYSIKNKHVYLTYH